MRAYLGTNLQETDAEALFNLALELLATTPWERGFYPGAGFAPHFPALNFIAAQQVEPLDIMPCKMQKKSHYQIQNGLYKDLNTKNEKKCFICYAY